MRPARICWWRATGLLITESAAPPVRATKDVDAIVEILSLTDYHALERRLENSGFRHDRTLDALLGQRYCLTSYRRSLPSRIVLNEEQHAVASASPGNEGRPGSFPGNREERLQ